MLFPKELYFISLEEEVEIIPTKNIPLITLLQYNYGPYDIYSQQPYVPLYAALILKKSDYCHIKIPDYLNVELLDNIISYEESENDKFYKMYPFVFELYKTLLENCLDVSHELNIKISAKVNEIYVIRQKKLLNGLKLLDKQAVDITNVTSYEYYRIKKYLCGSMSISDRLSKVFSL